MSSRDDKRPRGEPPPGPAETERDLAMRAAAIAAQKAELDKEAARLHDERTAQAKRDAEIASRTRGVEEREIEADAGFAVRNRDALATLAKAHADLRAQLVAVHGQIETERARGIENLDRWLAAQREVRQKALEAELTALRERAEREVRELNLRERARLERERDDHAAALAAERRRFDSEQEAFREKVEQTRKELDARDRELHRDLGRVAWREEEVEGRREALESAVEERAGDRVSALERQLEQLRDDYHRAIEQRTMLERKVEAHEQMWARFDGSPEELQRRLDEARKKAHDYERELLSRPSAADKERLAELVEQQRVWMEERARLLFELMQLRAERMRWTVGVAETEGQREQREIAERRLEALKAEMEKYAKEIEHVRSLYAPSEELAARVNAVKAPWRTDLRRAPLDAQLTEMAWLQRITEGCAGSGLRFPQRLLHAFHTSLKTAELSPLAVLAGVSGTGKSELPRLYARFGGIAFLPLAVQPNWDGPQALFGFFNSVDNRFNATSLLRAMVQSQRTPADDHGFADRLLLVLLDEMNLAHVEQYFSDLLSRLELRRGETSDVTLDIDLGAGVEAYRLPLGQNVLWVGTMNEDETTKALSDKVIDRSNLLYFPRPRKLHSRPQATLGEESALLPRTTWNSWIAKRSPFTPEEIGPFREALERINEHLEHVGRALGHRVWQSVEHYLANHPEVLDTSARGDQDARKRSMRRAFEDQLVLKVMPKLRGIETSGEARRRCLDPIRKQLTDPDLGLKLEEDFEIACRVGYGAFVWNSARYLEEGE